ncbi:hypothetical protein V1460_11160 [Streptomyces sp. SCSIO 30461]|uniref:8-oxoguanine DNA glycosylase OGG fold protein n=1 Tax=Streptomyces sp. SCSIO 30461 TaxID=3118085 RepID=UPI0030CB7C4C
MRYDQRQADKLDETMLELLLPTSAVESLGQWLADPERGQRYANGSGPHTIPYAPSTWMAVTPWPTTFADRAAADSASVSRAEVVAAVRAAEQSESWAEAFVATQVWGYGVTGYGPYRTRQVLAQPSAEAVLTEAVSLLVDEGAVAAYEVLHTFDGLGSVKADGYSDISDAPSTIRDHLARVLHKVMKNSDDQWRVPQVCNSRSAGI